MALNFLDLYQINIIQSKEIIYDFFKFFIFLNASMSFEKRH